VTQRRRVDWSVILAGDVPAPRIRHEPVPRDAVALLSAFDELLALDDPDGILRRAVELARAPIGLARAAIFLLDRSRDLMLGTWGSDLHGAIVDEHQIMYAVGEPDRTAFRRAQEDGAPFTVFEGCPIVEHRGAETVIGGRGWVAYTPIRSGDAPIGMLFNDAGLSGAPVDPARQAQAAMLCSLVGSLLDPVRSARGRGPGDPRRRRSGAGRRPRRRSCPRIPPSPSATSPNGWRSATRASRAPSRRRWGCRWSPTATGCASTGSRRCSTPGGGTSSRPPSRPDSAATRSFTACSARSGTRRPASTCVGGFDIRTLKGSRAPRDGLWRPSRLRPTRFSIGTAALSG